MKIINRENFDKFTYSNAELINGKPKALVFEFHGLGDGNAMIKEHPKLGRFFAEHNMVYAIPYYNPWGWMNSKSVSIIDEIADAIFDFFGVELPIISTGLSMGGYGALTFCMKSKHKIKACTALCPVCDLAYHYTEREDTPRTIYDAHRDGWEASGIEDFEKYLQSCSPLQCLSDMPKIPYMIIATTADEEVDYKKHSELFAVKAKGLGYDITYLVIPNRAHCDMSADAVEQYKAYIISNA